MTAGAVKRTIEVFTVHCECYSRRGHVNAKIIHSILIVASASLFKKFIDYPSQEVLSEVWQSLLSIFGRRHHCECECFEGRFTRPVCLADSFAEGISIQRDVLSHRARFPTIVFGPIAIIQARHQSEILFARNDIEMIPLDVGRRSVVSHSCDGATQMGILASATHCARRRIFHIPPKIQSALRHKCLFV